MALHRGQGGARHWGRRLDGSNSVGRSPHLAPRRLVMPRPRRVRAARRATEHLRQGATGARRPELADLRDACRIDEIFDQVRPDVVFHAAALKHLSLLEKYPQEAWKRTWWGP